MLVKGLILYSKLVCKILALNFLGLLSVSKVTEGLYSKMSTRLLIHIYKQLICLLVDFIYLQPNYFSTRLLSWVVFLLDFNYIQNYAERNYLMNKERNNKVRAALLAYIDLYNVNLKYASEDIKVDYTNLVSFKNGVRNMGDDSLRKIEHYLENTVSKQEELEEIIYKLKGKELM